MKIVNFSFIFLLLFNCCSSNNQKSTLSSNSIVDSPNLNTAIKAESKKVHKDDINKQYFLGLDTISLYFDLNSQYLRINSNQYRINVFDNNRFGMCGNLNLWPDFERGKYLALGYSCKKTIYYAYFSYNKNDLKLVSLHTIDNIDDKIVDISKNREDTICTSVTRFVDINADSFLSDTIFKEFPYFEKYKASKTYLNYQYRNGNWIYKARSKEEEFILYKFYNPM